MRTTAFGSRRYMVAMASTLTVVASLVALTPATAAGGDYASTSVAAQRAIEQSLQETGATSITAGLTDADHLLWQGSTGAIDASGAPPSPTTRYGIGSTSKMFATAAVMQLVDAGKIGLDQPVVRYLPDFTMASPQYRQITVRMLLDHSAGLPGSSYLNGFTTTPYADYADQMMDNLAHSELKTTPGAMSVYCNDCFTLAGEVVAKVSGMPFTTYVQRNLLAPMGMSSSQYVTARLPADGSVARVVVNDEDQPLEITNIYASGGLMSTPADALAFGRMLINDGMSADTRILSSASVAEMGTSQLHTTLHPVSRNVWEYGLGWDTVSDLTLQGVGVRAWVKGGDTGAYHASLIVAPDAGLAAFVAGAGNYGSSVAQAVAETILLNALVERGDIPALPAQASTEQPPGATPTEDDINAIVGTYLASSDLAHRVVRGPDSTIVLEQLVDGEWQPKPDALTFRADGAWWPDAPKAQYIRATTGWGRSYLVVAKPNGYGSTLGETIIGQRVTPSGRTDAAWQSRLGAWLFANEGPTSFAWLGVPATALLPIPDLPGYLRVLGLGPVDAHRPDLASMFLQVPLMYGRDLNDVVPVDSSRMRVGQWVLQQRDSVRPLTQGEQAVEIGRRGYAEWREVPAASRVRVRDASAWYLYDTELTLIAKGTKASPAAPAMKGALLVVLGDPGQVVSIDVTKEE